MSIQGSGVQLQGGVRGGSPPPLTASGAPATHLAILGELDVNLHDIHATLGGRLNGCTGQVEEGGNRGVAWHVTGRVQGWQEARMAWHGW